jgi:hypothetical protein
MKKAFAAALAALALAACGKSAPSVDKRLDAIGALKDRMCSCADMKCAADVQHDYKKWEDSDESPDIDHPSKQHLEKEFVEQYNQLDKGYEVCREKLLR